MTIEDAFFDDSDEVMEEGEKPKIPRSPQPPKTRKEVEEMPDSFSLYLKEARKYPLLTVEEEKELAKRVSLGDALAREQFICSNLRLVVAIAKKYSSDGHFQDLIEEGNIGLMKAVDKFDPGKGAKFSTYAVYWIEQSIQRYFDNRRQIRIPVHQEELLRKINHAKEELLQAGEEPTYEAIAAKISDSKKTYSAEKIEELTQMYGAVGNPNSLNDRVGEDEDSERADFVPFEDGRAIVHGKMECGDIERIVRECMSKLSSKEQKIIRRRFYDDCTLEEVAQECGLKRERIRQIEGEAKEKLRTYLTPYLKKAGIKDVAKERLEAALEALTGKKMNVTTG